MYSRSTKWAGGDVTNLSPRKVATHPPTGHDLNALTIWCQTTFVHKIQPGQDHFNDWGGVAGMLHICPRFRKERHENGSYRGHV